MIQVWNENFEHNYYEEKMLGQGSFGYVTLQRPKSNRGDCVARKMYSCNNESIDSTTVREVATMMRIGYHRGIVTLSGLGTSMNNFFITMKAMQTDLYKFIRKNEMAFNDIQNCYEKIVDGLAYLHACKFMHRDLKTSNILCSNIGSPDMELKIADLGLCSKHVHGRNNTLCVQTLWYRAPEVLLGNSFYDFSIDFWSVGVILLEMVIGNSSFVKILGGDCEIDQLFKIFRLLGTPTSCSWTECLKLPNYNADFPKWQSCDLKTLIMAHRSFSERHAVCISSALEFLFEYKTTGKKRRTMPTYLWETNIHKKIFKKSSGPVVECPIDDDRYICEIPQYCKDIFFLCVKRFQLTSITLVHMLHMTLMMYKSLEHLTKDATFVIGVCVIAMKLGEVDVICETDVCRFFLKECNLDLSRTSLNNLVANICISLKFDFYQNYIFEYIEFDHTNTCLCEILAWLSAFMMCHKQTNSRMDVLAFEMKKILFAYLSTKFMSPELTTFLEALDLMRFFKKSCQKNSEAIRRMTISSSQKRSLKRKKLE